MKENENKILLSFLEDYLNNFISLLEENDRSFIENFYKIFIQNYNDNHKRINTLQEIHTREIERYEKLISVKNVYSKKRYNERKRELEISISLLGKEIEELKNVLNGDKFYFQLRKIFNNLFDLLPINQREKLIGGLNQKGVDIERLFL